MADVDACPALPVPALPALLSSCLCLVFLPLLLPLFCAGSQTHRCAAWTRATLACLRCRCGS